MQSAEGLRAECPAPQMRRKTFKALGTPTVQADALSCDHTTLSAEQLVHRAEQRRAELEAAGTIDWVGDRQPYPTGQESVSVVECYHVCDVYTIAVGVSRMGVLLTHTVITH